MSQVAKLPDRMSAGQYLALVNRGMLAAKDKGAKEAGKTRRASPEEDLQRACFRWADLMRLQHPILRWLTHVPNGGKRPRGEAGKLKGMGAKPGIPDFMLPRRWRGWQGLAVELKSKDGRLSEAQKEWLEALEEDGYLCAVCRTLREFEVVVRKFLAGRTEEGSGSV